MIRKQLPDLVITDMNMPVMNGVKLTEYIHSHYPSIKMVVLSAYDDFDFVRQSMKNGAVDYLLKHQMNADTLLDCFARLKRTSTGIKLRGAKSIISRQQKGAPT